jgi:Fur family iron response transcriptional regulator
MLAHRLFGDGHHRHVSAEMLHREVAGERYGISLATVYNTLNAFAEHGLLRPIEGVGDRTYFDTNTASHHHFFIEDEAAVVDVPEGELCFARAPEPPDGMAIVDVQVIVRLRRVADAAGRTPEAPGASRP